MAEPTNLLDEVEAFEDWWYDRPLIGIFLRAFGGNVKRAAWAAWQERGRREPTTKEKS